MLIAMFISNIGLILQKECCNDEIKLVLNSFINETCYPNNPKVNCCCSNVKSQKCNDLNGYKSVKKCYTSKKYVKLETNQLSNQIIKHEQKFIIVAILPIENISLKENYSTIVQNFNIPKNWGRSLLINIKQIKIPSLT